MAVDGAHRRLADVARELDVQAVLEGSMTLEHDSAGKEHVRVRLNLVDPGTESELWTTSVDRDLGDVLALQSEIASTLAAQIRIALSTDDRERLGSSQSVRPEAYKLYQLGKQAASRRTAVDMKRALELFEQAVAIDSSYAPAYAALADTYTLMAGDFGTVPRNVGAARAEENADRALAIDPNMAEAHTSLAFVSFFLNWDWEVASRHFEKAIALNRSYPTAHHWYGDFLSAMGRESEAYDEMRRALELDPKSEIIARDVAWPLFFSGDYNGAISQLERTLAEHPRYTAAERLLGRALVQKGEYAKGIQLFANLSSRSDQPRAFWDLAWAYARAGRREDALRTVADGRAASSPVYEYDAALVWTALGDKAAALDELQKGFANRDPTMVNLRHDPRFETLRGDPVYESLVSRMKFPVLQ
jgi:tetratricopeptide (TPR) repeat protein